MVLASENSLPHVPLGHAHSTRSPAQPGSTAGHHVNVMPKHKLNALSMGILAGQINLDQSFHIPVTIRDQEKLNVPNSSTNRGGFACPRFPP